MKTLVVAIVLAAGGVVLHDAPAGAQPEPPLLDFSRICNIQPGRETEALALARQIAELGNRKYPGAQMAASRGRWMTGFQSLAEPVTQIRFTEQHADVETYEAFANLLGGDAEFQTLQRQAAAVIDFLSCVDVRFPATP